MSDEDIYCNPQQNVFLQNTFNKPAQKKIFKPKKKPMKKLPPPPPHAIPTKELNDLFRKKKPEDILKRSEPQQEPSKDADVETNQNAFAHIKLRHVSPPQRRDAPPIPKRNSQLMVKTPTGSVSEDNEKNVTDEPSTQPQKDATTHEAAIPAKELSTDDGVLDNSGYNDVSSKSTTSDEKENGTEEQVATNEYKRIPLKPLLLPPPRIPVETFPYEALGISPRKAAETLTSLDSNSDIYLDNDEPGQSDGELYTDNNEVMVESDGELYTENDCEPLPHSSSLPPLTSVPPPTSQLPSSLPPVSQPHSSLPPSSQTPTSQPPSSLPPISQPPSSLPPILQPPSSLPPISQPPSSLPPMLPVHSAPPVNSNTVTPDNYSSDVMDVEEYPLFGGIGKSSMLKQFTEGSQSDSEEIYEDGDIAAPHPDDFNEDEDIYEGFDLPDSQTDSGLSNTPSIPTPTTSVLPKPPSSVPPPKKKKGFLGGLFSKNKNKKQKEDASPQPQLEQDNSSINDSLTLSTPPQPEQVNATDEIYTDGCDLEENPDEIYEFNE